MRGKKANNIEILTKRLKLSESILKQNKRSKNWKVIEMTLYHVTTNKKAKQYHESGCIKNPVRGFTTLQAAMAWAIKTQRTVIYEVVGEPAYKLPDHHNKYGHAWWIDDDVNIEDIRCVFSAEKDA